MALLRRLDADAADTNVPAPATPVRPLSPASIPCQKLSLRMQCAWKIETFFRFFKHVLGCRHLLSHNTNGIKIQAYVGIIACPLIALRTGRKPTLRTYEMLCHYFTGLADEEELLAHIAKLKPQS
jgi:hypothetical protein